HGRRRYPLPCRPLSPLRPPRRGLTADGGHMTRQTLPELAKPRIRKPHHHQEAPVNMSSNNAPAVLDHPASHSRTFDTGLEYAPANVVRFPPREPLPQREPQPDHAALDLVRRLRPLLQLSLLQPRNDWDQACLLIAASPGAALE